MLNTATPPRGQAKTRKGRVMPQGLGRGHAAVRAGHSHDRRVAPARFHQSFRDGLFSPVDSVAGEG